MEYYKVLGIQKTASKVEIKNAYRNLASIYHPDKLIGVPNEIRLLAENKLKEINYAYSILSDVEKKRIYDKKWNCENQDHKKNELIVKINDLLKIKNFKKALEVAEQLYEFMPNDNECRDIYAEVLYVYVIKSKYFIDNASYYEAESYLRKAIKISKSEELKDRIKIDLENLNKKIQIQKNEFPVKDETRIVSTETRINSINIALRKNNKIFYNFLFVLLIFSSVMIIVLILRHQDYIQRKAVQKRQMDEFKNQKNSLAFKNRNLYDDKISNSENLENLNKNLENITKNLDTPKRLYEEKNKLQNSRSDKLKYLADVDKNEIIDRTSAQEMSWCVFNYGKSSCRIKNDCATKAFDICLPGAPERPDGFPALKYKWSDTVADYELDYIKKCNKKGVGIYCDLYKINIDIDTISTKIKSIDDKIKFHKMNLTTYLNEKKMITEKILYQNNKIEKIYNKIQDNEKNIDEINYKMKELENLIR